MTGEGRGLRRGAEQGAPLSGCTRVGTPCEVVRFAIQSTAWCIAREPLAAEARSAQSTWAWSTNARRARRAVTLNAAFAARMAANTPKNAGSLQAGHYCLPRLPLPQHLVRGVPLCPPYCFARERIALEQSHTTRNIPVSDPCVAAESVLSRATLQLLTSLGSTCA